MSEGLNPKEIQYKKYSVRSIRQQLLHPKQLRQRNKKTLRQNRCNNIYDKQI